MLLDICKTHVFHRNHEEMFEHSAVACYTDWEVRQMGVTKYGVFLKAAECGNFTRAAEELGFTQSGISHAVTALEEELGLKLLSRSRSGVTLTADGRRMLPLFQELDALQYRVEEVAHDLRGMEDGLIRVGAFASVSLQWMPYIFRTFTRQYPQIRFELLQGDDKEIEQWLLEGRIDCGFLSLPHQKVDSWLLYRDEWLVITAPDHPLAGREPFPTEVLATQPFIKLDEGDDYEIGAVFDELRIKPQIQFTVKQDQTILAMVAQGLGISIMPELMLQHSPYSVVPCHLSQAFYRNIGICVKDRKECSASTLRFVQHVQRWVLTDYRPASYRAH
jgi:DNA-binding transcriptional LysR family regulator